ncbi:MAG: GNAT family N-acetyltransferase [Acidobacteriota bacterium]|nr:GNAT family N-acetyltransferase [Acidobacteriota bacterium]
MTEVLETERLVLRHISVDDAEFILDLVNQPSFIKYIGDRNVRTLGDAHRYISNSYIASYKKFGFGLYLVELKQSKVPVGICGLVKRDSLPDVDIGFAFLPDYWSQGYASESALAVLDYARNVLKLKRILAITTKDNESSGKLLDKIGLKFEHLIRLNDDELKLFSADL